MKNAVFLLLTFFSVQLFAQQKAPFVVSVTDFKNVPLKGEQILFVSKNNGNTYKGVSDATGKFKIEVPGGDIYDIRIKSVGDAKDYNTMEIPAIGENEYYVEGQLTIMIEQPKYFTLDNVHFDSGKSTIKTSSFAELNELVEYLKLKPNQKIEIAGHTDNIGEEAANVNLSQKRADAVMNYLIKKGISAGRLVAIGYGETRPVADNSTEKGRKLNRRTEVHLK